MRNISFSLTTPQFLARTKTVTRRLGWLDVKVGELIMGCEKCMGRKPGEPLVRLGVIEVVSVRREPLDEIARVNWGKEECEKEGFPEMRAREFMIFFCRSHKCCKPDTVITRIEFRYL